MPRLTITVPDQNPQPYRFSLDRQVVHFGRADDNDIVIDSPSVSSEHAVMERVIAGHILTDLGSTNGIRLNDQDVKKIHLRNGQKIEIGDVVFGFELSEEEMIALRLEDPTSQLPSLHDDDDEPESAPKQESPKPNPQPDPGPKPEAETELDTAPAPQTEGPADDKSLPQELAQAAGSDEDSVTPSKSRALPVWLVGLAVVMALMVGGAVYFQKTTGNSVVKILTELVMGKD